MRFTVQKDRDLIITNGQNTQNENEAEKIILEVPEEFENFNKKIVFITPNDEIVWDIIVNNEYLITNAITQYEKVEVYVWLTNGNIDFRTKTKPLPFYSNKNASGEITPEEISGVNTVVNLLEEEITKTNNLNIDINKVGKVTTIDLTKKDGTQKQTELEDGMGLNYNWNNTSLGIKREDETQYTYVDLKGESGDDYILTQQDKQDIADLMNVTYHICSSSEYDSETRMPTISNPNPDLFYLVPTEDGQAPDLFTEWVYANDNWEMFGSASIDLSEYVKNTDYATNDTRGIVKGTTSGGVWTEDGIVNINCAKLADTKSGTNAYRPIVPSHQHEAAFYGLAKAAGDSSQSSSSNTVGTYTDTAKSAIRSMLGVQSATVVENISGTTPTITATENHMYICGEVTSLSFTPSATGICEVIFESGSTATVLTLPQTVKMPEWFVIEANATYEISILNGVYGAVMIWN